MPSSQQATFDEIVASVQALAQRAGTTPERAFAAWYAINFLDVDEDDALEAASVDGGEDQGIDFLYPDPANERVVLLQAHLPKSPGATTPKKKLDALTTAIAALDSSDTFDKAGRSDLAGVVSKARSKIDDHNYEAIAGLVTLSSRSDAIDRLIAPLNAGNRFAPFRIFYEHFEAISDQFESLKDATESGVAEDNIEFLGEFFTEQGEFGKAYVGTVSGAALAALYEKHRERLFARNVRLYLGTRKGSINEQIVETAKTDPGRFWALNNGITIVADTIAAAKPPAKGFRISRFSVVNGCQTTVSLWKAQATQSTRVLTRLVAAKQTVVNDIVRFNNTQNAVRIWTVRAADQVQKRLTDTFKEIGVAYAPKPSTARRSGSTAPAIQLDRLAQYIAATRSLVTEAVQEKSELFDRYYQTIFPHDLSAEDAFQAWLIGSIADELRQARFEALRTSSAAVDALPFLTVAGTYWISFCAARLVNEFNKQPVRLKLKAMVADSYRNALRKYVEQALDLYFDLASDTYEPDEYGSPRQAMRSVKFFQRVSKKLDNKIASLKTKKTRLPDLEGAVKSAKR